MLITDNKKIHEVQEEFNELFPNLKIEFYKKPHDSGEGSPEKEKCDPQSSIGKVRSLDTEGDFKIQGNQKVSTLEAQFKSKYGLHVQVFRRSANDIWLQTTSTDNWTLAEQNERGEVYNIKTEG